MRIACAAFALLLAAFPALAQNVKITPIGSHPGELCANDRAIIFEDPTGVRFLYDTGHTVTGGNDPRLGTIHLVLLSHMHGDHVGDLKLKAPGEGTCANSARVPAPNSTTAEVVAAKNAVLVTTRAMAGFVHNKVDAIRGSGSKPMDFCPTLAVTVPVPAACSSRIDLGGVFTAQAEGAKQGVEFTIVYSAHVNDVAPSLLSKAQQDLLKADGAQLGVRPTGGLRGEVHQRARRVPVERHGRLRRHEDGHPRLLQGEPGRDQSRAEPGPLPVRRVRHQRPAQAGLGDLHARERGRDGRRQAEGQTPRRRRS